MTTTTLLLQIIVGIGLLGGIGYGFKAWYERKLLRATAASTEAGATAVIVAAARELVDPLRIELAKERQDHSEEIEIERRKVAQVRLELQKALGDCTDLRHELNEAQDQLHNMRLEMRRLQAENLEYRRRIVEVDKQEGNP